MTQSFTVSQSKTFTLTNAKHIASKVATDLKRLQRLYGEPSDQRIENFETELIQFLKYGYLGTVTYGFQRNGKWIEPTLRYTAEELSHSASIDDDPGKIRIGANVENARFRSFLTYSTIWYTLNQNQQTEFRKQLPFERVGAEEPKINGYLVDDKMYSSGGRALNRKSVRSY